MDRLKNQCLSKCMDRSGSMPLRPLYVFHHLIRQRRNAFVAFLTIVWRCGRYVRRKWEKQREPAIWPVPFVCQRPCSLLLPCLLSPAQILVSYSIQCFHTLLLRENSALDLFCQLRQERLRQTALYWLNGYMFKQFADIRVHRTRIQIA